VLWDLAGEEIWLSAELFGSQFRTLGEGGPGPQIWLALANRAAYRLFCQKMKLILLGRA